MRNKGTLAESQGSYVLHEVTEPLTFLVQDEDFYQISLDVRGKRTLAESLDSYVQRELMDGENQWECEDLGRKVMP